VRGDGYAERHDNIETVCKKLQEKRDTADVTEVLKALHRIVNEAIRAAAPGGDHGEDPSPGRQNSRQAPTVPEQGADFPLTYKTILPYASLTKSKEKGLAEKD
jgi:hypothetical protein